VLGQQSADRQKLRSYIGSQKSKPGIQDTDFDFMENLNKLNNFYWLIAGNDAFGSCYVARRNLMPHL